MYIIITYYRHIYYHILAFISSTPTKFGEDRSKDLGGDREQTDRQTDKRCSIYSMILSSHLLSHSRFYF